MEKRSSSFQAVLADLPRSAVHLPILALFLGAASLDKVTYLGDLQGPPAASHFWVYYLTDTFVIRYALLPLLIIFVATGLIHRTSYEWSVRHHNRWRMFFHTSLAGVYAALPVLFSWAAPAVAVTIGMPLLPREPSKLATTGIALESSTVALLMATQFVLVTIMVFAVASLLTVTSLLTRSIAAVVIIGAAMWLLSIIVPATVSSSRAVISATYSSIQFYSDGAWLGASLLLAILVGGAPVGYCGLSTIRRSAQ